MSDRKSILRVLLHRFYYRSSFMCYCFFIAPWAHIKLAFMFILSFSVKKNCKPRYPITPVQPCKLLSTSFQGKLDLLCFRVQFNLAMTTQVNSMSCYIYHRSIMKLHSDAFSGYFEQILAIIFLKKILACCQLQNGQYRDIRGQSMSFVKSPNKKKGDFKWWTTTKSHFLI